MYDTGSRSTRDGWLPSSYTSCLACAPGASNLAIRCRCLRPEDEAMASKRSRGRKDSATIGYAVVGLGHIAQTAVLPAFVNARNARLAALVSDDEKKREKLSRKYGAPAYSYDEYDECLRRDDVYAVHLPLPKTMHASDSVSAA